MTDASRRGVLGAAGIIGAAAAAPAAATQGRRGGRGGGRERFDAAWHQAVLERYDGFGVKASGGPGDNACGAWIEGELSRLGYACERQVFQAPFFEVREASLTTGRARAEVIPQAVVVPTGPGGVAGPLRLATDKGPLDGAIAVIPLPYARWSSSLAAPVRLGAAEAIKRGAAAVVLITTGPTGEAVALNCRPEKPAFERPVAVLAPKDAQPFLAAAARGEPGRLTVDGNGGRRPAWNLIARLDRRAARTLIVSTPRSGWFRCAAERGSGVSIWLSVAEWAVRGLPKVNLELLCTSGHEYEYQGGEFYMEHARPDPKHAMWVHVGANGAARDWHELGANLSPLPSTDAQRVVMGSPEVVPILKRAFAGVNGLEAAYPATPQTAAGELTNVLKAGYSPAVGHFGTHRFHHTRADDMRCISGELVKPAADGFRAAVAALAG